MKEDGINKLIKLLNEYDDGMVSWYEEYFSTEGLFVTNAGQGFREEFILGKRYGFIKRLVENDKIDTRKLENYIYFHNDYKFVANRELKDKYPNEIYTDHLLMILSIQDNPIEFLCSVIK